MNWEIPDANTSYTSQIFQAHLTEFKRLMNEFRLKGFVAPSTGNQFHIERIPMPNWDENEALFYRVSNSTEDKNKETKKFAGVVAFAKASGNIEILYADGWTPESRILPPIACSNKGLGFDFDEFIFLPYTFNQTGRET